MEKLTDKEIESFMALSNESFELQENKQATIVELQKRKLLKSNLTVKWWLPSLAAAVVFFIVGYFSTSFLQKTIPASQQQYALFLYENASFTVVDENRLVQEYTTWAVNLSQQEKLAGAEKLDDDIAVWLGESSVKNVNSAISGYFIIYAQNLEEAQEIAKSHPHITYGGGIELRPIELLK